MRNLAFSEVSFDHCRKVPFCSLMNVALAVYHQPNSVIKSLGELANILLLGWGVGYYVVTRLVPQQVKCHF